MYLINDTNIWIVLEMIGLSETVFKIPNAHFVIDRDMLDDEVLTPPGFKTHLIESGLQPVGITDEELVLAMEYKRIQPFPIMTGRHWRWRRIGIGHSSQVTDRSEKPL